jgi:hypothetical protein
VPNGRSGGFIIETIALARLVKAMPEALGATVTFGENPRPRPIHASEMVWLLEKSPNDRLAVEEQDHSWYIVHINNEPEIIWDNDSPKVAALPGNPRTPPTMEYRESPLERMDRVLISGGLK